MQTIDLLEQLMFSHTEWVQTNTRLLIIIFPIILHRLISQILKILTLVAIANPPPPPTPNDTQCLEEPPSSSPNPGCCTSAHFGSP